MGLMICQDCRKAYSDRAAACPNCGRPSEEMEEKAQAIELTSKRYKLAKLIGGLAFVFGLMAVMGTACDPITRESTPTTAIITIIGGLVYLWGSLGKWWHHE
mgnify:CR=1 FL=1